MGIGKKKINSYIFIQLLPKKKNQYSTVEDLIYLFFCLVHLWINNREFLKKGNDDATVRVIDLTS